MVTARLQVRISQVGLIKGATGQNPPFEQQLHQRPTLIQRQGGQVADEVFEQRPGQGRALVFDLVEGLEQQFRLDVFFPELLEHEVGLLVHPHHQLVDADVLAFKQGVEVGPVIVVEAGFLQRGPGVFFSGRVSQFCQMT